MMNNKRIKRTFSNEFKDQIVKIHENGKPIQDIVREYNIHRKSVVSWIKQYNSNKRIFAKLNPTEQRLVDMEKQLAQALLENEILKQAALILGKKEK